MELCTSISLGLGFVVLYTIWNYFSTKNLPPGPSGGWPILGHLLSLDPKSPYLTLAQWAREHGDIFSVKMGTKRWVVINDHTLLREALNDPALNGRPIEESFSAFSGGRFGILFTDGEEWSVQRNFTLRHLRDFGFGKKAGADMNMVEIEELLASFKRMEGKSFYIGGKFNVALLNGLWPIVSGLRYSHDDPKILSIFREQKDITSEYGNVLLSITPEWIIQMAPTFFGLQKLRDASKHLHAVLGAIVKEHRESLDENCNRDFIDAYLNKMEHNADPSSSFTEEVGMKHLLGTISELFTSAFDPTLEWTALYLAVHQDVQKKLHEELDRVIGKNRPVVLDDRPGLPYVEALMHEILRITSIASLGLPHRVMKETRIRGWVIPEGTWVISNLHYIQNNPAVWGDPATFRPERFLEPDGRTLVKYEAFLTFSAGKRRCLGDNFQMDQMFLFLTNMYQRFGVELDPKAGKPSFVPDLGNGGVLTPKRFQIILRERTQSK